MTQEAMVDWDGSTAPELLIVLLTRQIVGPCFGEGLLAFLLKEIAIAGTRGLDIGDRSVGVAFSPQQPPSDAFSFAHITRGKRILGTGSCSSRFAAKWTLVSHYVNAGKSIIDQSD